MSVREIVFIQEQNVPEGLEIDEYDDTCLHILALDANKPVATARLLNDGHIGRMCVLKNYRLKGIATELLKRLIQAAQQKQLKIVQLHAQLTAISFYEKSGFKVCSNTFMDAGIEHKTMSLELAKVSSIIELDSRITCRETVVSMIKNAKHSIAIFSQKLEYALYHQSEINQAIKSLIRSNRKAKVRIICKDTRSAAQHSHYFINLAQRFSSTIEIRVPVTQEIKSFQQSWLLVDDDAYCHIKNLERFKGKANLNDKKQARESLIYFNHAWEQSEIDQQTRRLSL